MSFKPWELIIGDTQYVARYIPLFIVQRSEGHICVIVCGMCDSLFELCNGVVTTFSGLTIVSQGEGDLN